MKLTDQEFLAVRFRQSFSAEKKTAVVWKGDPGDLRLPNKFLSLKRELLLASLRSSFAQGGGEEKQDVAGLASMRARAADIPEAKSLFGDAMVVM